MAIEFVLKETLWDLRLKQKEAALKCGIPENTMSRICAGKVVLIPLNQVDKLCSGLSIPIEKVFRHVPDK